VSKIPPEIRLKIYEQVFRSTRITHGVVENPSDTDVVSTYTKPCPNALALLRVCRLFNREIDRTWISQVYFNFLEFWTMLAKLRPLSPDIRAKIRHIRLLSHSWGLQPDTPIFFNPIPAFGLLFELRLETLTVVGNPHKAVNINKSANLVLLNLIVASSQGWKKLFFMCEESQMHAGGPVPTWLTPKLLQGHALHLQNALKRRDGRDSGASVTLYRGTSGVREWMNTDQRAENAIGASKDGKSQNTAAAQDAGGTPDLVLPPGGQQGNVVFLITRGDHVDYTVTSPETDLEDADLEEAIFTPVRLRSGPSLVGDGWGKWADTFMNEFRYMLPVNADSLRQDQ
jgi:hypothetical protein